LTNTFIPFDMRAYYFDDQSGDQRLAHDSGVSVSFETLQAIGVLHWAIPIDDKGKWEGEINAVAKERGYKNRDIINVSKEGLGDAYESKIKTFFEEYVSSKQSL
jgi:1,2-dihydroxy-3-keto-5-methylthiopentene dioxygenase